MFNSIQGIITQKLADAVYVLTGGVEWDISVPALDAAKLPPVGEKGRLFTWLYHREDQMKLFGFADERRRGTFLDLLKVEGIGPRAALKIMGGIGQEEFETALETEDISRLEAIPGLGKKTAQKMILALKGKLTHIAARPETPYGDLLEALMEMGYDRKAAAEALSRVEARLPPNVSAAEKEQLLFKEAIVYLSTN